MLPNILVANVQLLYLTFSFINIVKLKLYHLKCVSFKMLCKDSFKLEAKQDAFKLYQVSKKSSDP